MGKRNDFYIDYKRSNKKRGRRGRNKYWITIFIIMAICLGLIAYFIFKSGQASFLGKNTSNNPTVTVAPTNEAGSQSEQPEEQSVTPVAKIVPPANTIQPTALPTQTIVPTAKAATNNDLVVDDTKSSEHSGGIRGIYVPAKAAGSDKINDLIDMVDHTEINAMVIDVKDDHGKISFAMDCDLAKEIGAVTDTIPDMKALVKKLKEKNIYLIARIVAFKDPYLAEKRPDMAIKNQDGSLYQDSNGENWVNPYKKKVWSYLLDVAAQAALIGFDEIQFDYIRFSTSKGISEADLGKEAAIKSRETIITEFTKYIYGKLKPLGVAVSADVYGTIIASSVDAKLVGQNFVEMSKYLDYICPMIYPSHFGEGNFGIDYPDTEPFKIISKVLAMSASKLNGLSEEEHHAVVRPWLQDFTATWIEHHIDYGGEEIREEIEGVYSVGFDEWLLWNAGCNYSVDGLKEQ